MLLKGPWKEDFKKTKIDPSHPPPVHTKDEFWP